jgi:hypothetical protein
VNRDFREEYGGTSFSSNLNDVPPRVSVFLLRHGIVPARCVRIEERLVKPEDSLFIVGTLAENPGVPVGPFSVRNGTLRDPATTDLSEPLPLPEVIRLQNGEAPSTTHEMSQQAKIAAALSRAGITRPEAWFAAGVPFQAVAIEDNASPAPVSTESSAADQARPDDTCPDPAPLQQDQPKPSDFNLTPPVVLMKGANDPTFVISFRSQRELVSELGWKSAALVWGGGSIVLLGLYMLLLQAELL